jgi:hypothetical protein
MDIESCERRVYRLATLLTGDRAAAAVVIEAVLAARPRLDDLDGAHMDRLTVLRSREIPPAILFGRNVHAPSAEALARLECQQREAWVFARVFRLPSRDVARAMDCSVTAAQRHLERADALMQAARGEGAAGMPEAAAAEQLRALVVRLDTPPLFRARREARQRMRRTLRWIIVAIVLVIAAAAVLCWQRAAMPR